MLMPCDGSALISGLASKRLMMLEHVLLKRENEGAKANVLDARENP